jgi:hypothetical protein
MFGKLWIAFACLVVVGGGGVAEAALIRGLRKLGRVGQACPGRRDLRVAVPVRRLRGGGDGRGEWRVRRA